MGDTRLNTSREFRAKRKFKLGVAKNDLNEAESFSILEDLLYLEMFTMQRTVNTLFDSPEFQYTKSYSDKCFFYSLNSESPQTVKKQIPPTSSPSACSLRYANVFRLIQ